MKREDMMEREETRGRGLKIRNLRLTHRYWVAVEGWEGYSQLLERGVVQ